MEKKTKMRIHNKESEESNVVSVIIPVKNGEEYINQCLTSIFSQTYKFLEVIIVDGGSKDRTLEISSNFDTKIIHQVSKGVSSARNEGIKKATGKYIAWCDIDDFYAPNKIEMQKKFLDLHQDIGLVYTDIIILEEGKKAQTKVKTEEVNWEWFKKNKTNPISFSSTMISGCLLKKNKINPKLRIGEDFDLYLRLSKLTKFALISEPLTFIRKHKTNLTNNRFLSLKSHVIILYINNLINRREYVYGLFLSVFIFFTWKILKKIKRSSNFLKKWMKRLNIYS